MNFNLFSLFQKKKSDFIVPDSMLVKRVKSLSKNSNLKVFSNIEIFHHKLKHQLDLIVYDDSRGIYIFEIKKWSFDDLKNATIQKAQNQEHSSNTLAFDNTQEIIKKKFNEITHIDGPTIYNYLLMENLSTDEYEHLNDSFKELLPQEKIIFNDSEAADIFKKLQSVSPLKSTINTDKVLGTLLTQYTKLDENGNFVLCNDEEISFLNTSLTPLAFLELGEYSSKTSLLILKSIIEVFKNNLKKVLIIKPSILARDIAYQKYLMLLEHGIIELDINAIEMLTPLELINKHLQKLKKPMIENEQMIDHQMLKKSFDVADLIICDDAYLLNDNFIAYLKHIQRKKQLLFVNLQNKEFGSEKITIENKLDPTIEFIQTIPLAKTMQLIQKLLQDVSPKEILVISNPKNKENLQEDLEFFIEESTLKVDGKKTLIEQNIEELKLATYEDMFELNVKHIILLDLCECNEKQIEYAFNLATKNVYFLYDDSCEFIELLKEKYESTQERAGVEATTDS